MMSPLSPFIKDIHYVNTMSMIPSRLYTVYVAGVVCFSVVYYP